MLKDKTHNLYEYSVRLIRRANKEHILVRLIGGCAINYRFIDTIKQKDIFREIKDIDVIVGNKDLNKFVNLIKESGFHPANEFNYIYGSKRRVYKMEHIIIDVFINTIDMNCKIEIPAERLSLDDYAIPLLEILIEKLQIYDDIKYKYLDLALILLSDEFNNIFINRGEQIFYKFYKSNWSLYKLSINNLRAFENYCLKSQDYNAYEKHLMVKRAEYLIEQIENAPKTILWKLRNIIGERIKYHKEISHFSKFKI